MYGTAASIGMRHRTYSRLGAGVRCCTVAYGLGVTVQFGQLLALEAYKQILATAPQTPAELLALADTRARPVVSHRCLLTYTMRKHHQTKIAIIAMTLVKSAK